MKHGTSLLIKFAVVSLVLFSILSALDGMSFFDILMISLAVTGVAYFVGDMMILPRFGNIVATIADFGLAFFTTWFLAELLADAYVATAGASALAAFFIAATELFYHMYIQRMFFPDEFRQNMDGNKLLNKRPGYLTEFAEENDDQDYIKLYRKNNNNKK